MGGDRPALIRMVTGMSVPAEHGVRWPTASADRKPDYTSPAAAETPSDQLF